MRKSIAFATLSLFISATAHATVVGVTNGDFEAQGVGNGGTTYEITSWYESNTTDSNPNHDAYYADWLYHNTSVFQNSTTVAGFSGAPGGGYIYQQIGTYSANEAIKVTGTLDKVTYDNPGNFTVYLLSGNFPGASDNTPPLSLTLIDSASFTAAGLGMPTGPGTAQAAWTANFNAGTLGVNGEGLWLAITPNNPDGSETFLDNIQAVTAPEPSSLSAVGIGGMMLLRRRRK